MNRYVILDKDNELFVIEADDLTCDKGLLIFIREVDSKIGKIDEQFAFYPLCSVKSVTLQNKYTEQEILDQVTNYA